jgi:hypothetical protein
MADAPIHARDKHPLLMTPAAVAIAGWVLPGLGYVLLGERVRGITIIAGIRVIDVPGYDKYGFQDRVDATGHRVPRSTDLDYQTGHWALLGTDFVAEIAAKPWYVGQIFAGPINLIASAFSIYEATQNLPMSHARLQEIGTLYTAIAGMLNLLAILDASSRAAHPEQSPEPAA